jgi:hypothetical protein
LRELVFIPKRYEVALVTNIFVHSSAERQYPQILKEVGDMKLDIFINKNLRFFQKLKGFSQNYTGKDYY